MYYVHILVYAVCCNSVHSFQLLLFTLSRANLFRPAYNQEQYNSAVSSLPWYLAPPWEYMLHEIILKSINPPLLNTNTPHKRPLDASFYGGPVDVYSNDDVNVVLSRGDIYRLANGRWILCQEGCVNCEPCAIHRNPLFKWILRRLERSSLSDPPQHDLQLTIMPQTDDRFYIRNTERNSYVYVTSQEEQSPVLINRSKYDDNQNSWSSLENTRQLVEQDPIVRREENQQGDNHAIIRENVNTELTKREGSPEPKYRFWNLGQHRPRFRQTKEAVTKLPPIGDGTAINETNRSISKLILGTDQHGQKHLVHVVPISVYSQRTSFAANDPLSANQPTNSRLTTIPKDEEQTYQELFHRIFDLLNTHRRSIKNFLTVNDTNVQGTPSSTDNIESAGSSWNDRDPLRNIGFSTMRINDESSLPLKTNNQIGRYQQYKNIHDYQNVRQYVKDYSRDFDQVKMLHEQMPMTSSRHRMYTNPYSTNIVKKNHPRVISPILAENSNNSGIDAILLFDSSNKFAVTSPKGILFNDTIVDREILSNNSVVGLSSLQAKHENEKLFNLERRASTDDNKKFDVSQQSDGIIATTESSIIPKEHKISSCTKTVIASD